MAGASPIRPAGDLLLADMDQAAQESAGGQHHRAAAIARAVRRAHAASPVPSATIRSSTSASRSSGRAASPSAACMACAIELAVGLGARTAHRRALAAVEQRGTGCRPRRPPGPSARRARRSRAPDGPCPARRSPDCRTSRRWSRRWCVTSAVRAPKPRGGGRRLAAGVAAADDDDIVMRDGGVHGRDIACKPRLLSMSFHVKHTRPGSASPSDVAHLPMQKRAKIAPSTSSGAMAPTMRPRLSAASLSSSATSSSVSGWPVPAASARPAPAGDG